MIIHELRSKNVKRLRAVAFQPDGSLIIVGGENGNGKSSFLDSIKYAVGGKKAQCTRPVREGATKAEIFVDMGDYSIECTITPSGKHVVIVKDANGVAQRSPQALLDRLYGDLSLDPLEFTRMDKWKRLETLKQLVGLDFSSMDTQRADYYAHRTEINRKLKESRAQYDELPEYPEVGFESKKAGDILVKMKEVEDHNKTYTELMGKAQKMRDAVARADERIMDIRDKINDLIEEKEGIELAQKEDIEKELEYQAEAKKHGEKDITEIMEEFKSIEEFNEKVDANMEAKVKGEEVESLEKASKLLTKNIEEIDSCKNESMKKAKFPIDGLSFSSEGVLYNGVPYEQCAQSEQLRVSVAMGLAMNPTLRVLLIRDGSLLDQSNRKLVAEMAAEADPPAQVWMECVGKGEDSTVIIEDGMILGDESTQSTDGI